MEEIGNDTGFENVVNEIVGNTTNVPYPTPTTGKSGPFVVNVSQHTQILHNELGHFVRNVPQRTEATKGCGSSKVGTSMSTIRTEQP